MFASLMLVAALLSASQASPDGPTAVTGGLRGVDDAMRTTITEGCRRSPTFARLVQDVERSRFIVYVEAVPELRGGMLGALLHSAGGRYLRINLKQDLPLDRKIAVLAHELQHVHEVLEAGISADAASMEMLFRRIGGRRSSGRRQQFETVEAFADGRSGCRRPSGEPGGPQPASLIAISRSRRALTPGYSVVSGDPNGSRSTMSRAPRIRSYGEGD